MITAIGPLTGGTPILKIELSGIFRNPAPAEFSAIIDTGFSGFVAMPLIQAFPLGLALSGSTTVTLADGSKHIKLTAIGTATIKNATTGQNVSKPGLIILEPGPCDVLLGMDFLRSFNAALFVLKNGFALFDEDEIKKIIQTQQPAAQAAAAQPPVPPTAAVPIPPKPDDELSVPEQPA